MFFLLLAACTGPACKDDTACPGDGPAIVELCNGVDDDGDGQVDEEAVDAPVWYPDLDGDGFGAPEESLASCQALPGRVTDATDCDDDDAGVHPGAPETCDDADQDCDGTIDEDATDARAWYPDLDGDAYGDTAAGEALCARPTGWIANDGDCDDADATVHPGAPESCDGDDDDCDGLVDEDAADAATWYPDADADGFGVDDAPLAACEASHGYAPRSGDCDDADATAFPGSPEVCDGDDEDCDGLVDEASATDATRWYEDRDGDGYGGTTSALACTAPAGYVALDGDCDDRDDTAYPGAPEAAGSGDDSDCDGYETCFADVDRDGYGGAGTVASADSDCRDAGEASTQTDCDDADATIHPRADEVAYDGVDQDCDGVDLTDVDGDGYDAAATGGDDCDDGEAAIHPGAIEVCDPHDADEDCDGLADGADPDLAGTTTWYTDADGDGAGDPATATRASCEDADQVANGDDCDDTDPSVYPLADEACDDLVDRNCDGFVGTDDADGDGFAACDECDDGDAAVHPGAVDVANGRDDDCDGLVDEYVGDLELATAGDVTTFCASWASVEGNLDLDGLSTLAGLSCLRAVSGHLRLSDITADDFTGLENLTDVGGDLLAGGWQAETRVLGPSTFTSLDGLGRLRRVGGDLWVAENDVADLSGAGRLAFVGGSVTLWSLPLPEARLPVETLGGDLWLQALPDLVAVSAPSLTTFGGSLWIEDVARASGGFELDWPHTIPGSLGLLGLPVGANAGWSLPDTVGAIYVEDTDLLDLTGLEPIRTVAGDVLVAGNDDLGDLGALDGIEEIGGDLALQDNPSLSAWDGFPALVRVGGWVRLLGAGPTTADGFGALQSVGEGLDVEDASALVTITGFGDLRACGSLLLTNVRSLTDVSGLAGVPFTGDVTVSSATSLTDLSFLAATSALDGSLSVTGNTRMVSLDGLGALTSVGGAFDIRNDSALASAAAAAVTTVGGGLTLRNLPALRTVDLGALTWVGGDVALEELDGLPDLTGFGALEEAGGLWISQLDALTDLSGLDALRTVRGSVIVEDQSGLRTLAGLGALESVEEDLRISGDSALVDLGGLDALVSVGRDLTLDSNRALVRPDSLGALETIGRDLWVESNGALLDLGGMGTFTVGNTVWLFENNSMVNLTGLDGLAEVPGNLVLASLDDLTDTTALGRVQTVGGDLRVGSCASLPSLAGLDALTVVGGSVEIGVQASWPGWGGKNGALVDLDGLAGLRTIGGDLWLEEDVGMTDIDGLDGLEAIGGNLGVIDNISLPTADAMDLADGTPTVGGTIRIAGNL